MNAEEVVRAEMQAWSTLDVDQIMGYFTPDATWMPSLEHPTVHGYDAVRREVERFVKVMTASFSAPSWQSPQEIPRTVWAS